MTSAPPQRPDIRLSIRQSDGAEHDVVIDHRRERYLIGRREARRDSNVDLTLPDRHASRRHCEIATTDDGWAIRDLLSSNGTRIDGEPISDTPVPLLDGQQIAIGLTLITVTFDWTGTAVDTGYGAATAAIAVGGGDETVQGGAEGTVILNAGSNDEMATVVFPYGAPAVENDDGATVLAQEATRLVVPLAHNPFADDAGGHGGETVLATTVTLPPSRTATATVTTATAATLGGPLQARSASGSSAPLRPVSVSAEGMAARQANRRQDLYRAGFRGIALDLVADVFPEEARVTALCRQAQETGRTFFRMLADDSGIKAHEEIYEYVAKALGIDLLKNEKDLMEQAIEEPWLTYAQAGSLGAVLLAGGGDDTVLYATLDPYDIVTADWIAKSANRPKVRKLLVLPMVFNATIQRLKNRNDDVDGSASVLVINLDSETEREIQMKVESVEVPKIVNYFLQKSFYEGASDIHIEPTEDFLLVRNRVDGILHELTSLPATMHPEIVSRIKILSGMDVAEKRRPQDGRIATVIRENAIDVRVSSYPTIYGEKIVMRLLDKNALRPSPEHLGMISRDLRLLYDKLDAPFGLVMISGPTGSGKTTTLYSCLSYIDKKTKNVLTVEDPVEYRLKGVHQMQVNERIGLTFASGLRTILRQDPDVIMVGECRDAETASMAIQAALTGHIVFSTIHTNDAVGVITRLIDMGVEPFLVANALSLCIAQRLVRRVCQHCQAPEEGQAVLERLHNDGVSDERLASLGIVIDTDLTYVTGRGCVHCRNTGYQGRQAVFEVFEINQEARNEIVSPKFSADALRRRARASSMTTLIGHGLMQIDEGVTTHAEIIRVLGEAY